MTSPSGMSCETCQDLLIELVCDELVAETAAAVRAHALKCERCGPELEKLSFTLKASRDLDLLAPSPEVELRIMQAAREGIAGRARGPAREAAATAGSSFGITEWFARLGSFAMSPQVAMASVLLLVVGIGLYALPIGQNDEQSALRATEEDQDERSPAPAPSASAAAAPMAPAEPLAREEEMRGAGREQAKRRGHSLEERELAKGTQTAKDVGALGSVRPRKAAGPEDLARSATARGAEPGDGFGEGKAERAVQAFPGAKTATKPQAAASGGAAVPKQSSPSKSLDALADDFAPSARAQGAGSAQPAPVVQAPARKKEAASEKVGGASAPANRYAAAPPPVAAPKNAPVGAKAWAPEAEAASSQPAGKGADKRAKSDAPSALEQGIAAVKRGDHAQAESLLKPIASGGTGSDRTTAMLWLARSLRARGDCAAALNFYRALTQPVNAARAVLEEAADCHARTGNAAAAERLRARAALPAKQ